MGGEKIEMYARPKYWSHGWCFTLQLKRFMEQEDVRVERTLQNL